MSDLMCGNAQDIETYIRLMCAGCILSGIVLGFAWAKLDSALARWLESRKEEE